MADRNQEHKTLNDAIEEARKGEVQVNRVVRRHTERMMDKPKIYCFSAMKNGGDGIAYAMAEDGTVLGSHWCSHEGFVSGDLGVTEGSRPDRHERYAKHYPDGYVMEFVRSSDIDDHIDLQRAFELNKQQCEAKAAQPSNVGGERRED